jgi:hypothetical protein
MPPASKELGRSRRTLLANRTPLCKIHYGQSRPPRGAWIETAEIGLAIYSTVSIATALMWKFAERLEINLLRFPNSEAFRPHGLTPAASATGSMSRPLDYFLMVDSSTRPSTQSTTSSPMNSAMSPSLTTAAFFQRLDRVFPDWRRRKERVMARLIVYTVLQRVRSAHHHR